MKSATEQQIFALNQFLQDNNLILKVEVITTYPNGTAQTSAIANVFQKEEVVAETTTPQTPQTV